MLTELTTKPQRRKGRHELHEGHELEIGVEPQMAQISRTRTNRTRNFDRINIIYGIEESRTGNKGFL
jgi:hypothetical protein